MAMGRANEVQCAYWRHGRRGCVRWAVFRDRLPNPLCEASKPVAIASLDELLLIIRRGANVGFDPELLRFHLYGTDVVLTAYSQGKSAYVMDIPAIHNSNAGRRIGPG